MVSENKICSVCGAETHIKFTICTGSNEVFMCDNCSVSFPHVTKFRCPYCSALLKEGEKREYETLVDHVSDPNMDTYPLRETLVCSCEESKDMFWDTYGDCHRTEWGNGKFPDAIRTIVNNYV